MLTDGELQAIKDRHSCAEIAGKRVRLRSVGKNMVGPCPICSLKTQSKTAVKFKADHYSWMCAKCQDGGDVISLVRRLEDCSFGDAIKWLGGPQVEDHAKAEARAAEAKREAAEKAKEQDRYRQEERGRLYKTWQRAAKFPGSGAEQYMRLRCGDVLPPLTLRYHPNMPFFHGETEGPTGTKLQRVIHRGPAMLAPTVTPAGVFVGLHLTYIDFDRPPKFKALIIDPDTGEEINAKKVRGSKAGNHIDLIVPSTVFPYGKPDDPDYPPPDTLIIGEGIETVCAVWIAMMLEGINWSRTLFRSSADLGNIGGKAVESVRHPTLKTPKGHARRVPGPFPDLTSPAYSVPPGVRRVIQLGDGDSDRLLTWCTLHRGQERHRSAEREVLTAWAPAGMDLLDLLRAP